MISSRLGNEVLLGAGSHHRGLLQVHRAPDGERFVAPLLPGEEDLVALSQPGIVSTSRRIIWTSSWARSNFFDTSRMRMFLS